MLSRKGGWGPCIPDILAHIALGVGTLDRHADPTHNGRHYEWNTLDESGPRGPR